MKYRGKKDWVYLEKCKYFWGMQNTRCYSSMSHVAVDMGWGKKETAYLNFAGTAPTWDDGSKCAI